MRVEAPSLFDQPASPPLMVREALISPDQVYRYHLHRRWADQSLPTYTLIMLNPSVADGTVDDPTIRRGIGFARAAGAGTLHVLNLYALRSTDPKQLWRHPHPVGPRNDEYLLNALEAAAAADQPVIAAWGAHAKPDRVAAFLAMASDAGASIAALGVTKAGAPRHPLYLPASATPKSWPPP